MIKGETFIMRKMPITKDTALGGPGPYNLVGVEDGFDWSSGTKGLRIGTHYTILRLTDMEKQRVFIRDTAPAIPADAVLQGAAAMQFYQVNFNGLAASVSADKSGNLRVYAEASAIQIVQPQAAQKRDG